MSESETVTVLCEIIKKTDEAVLISSDDENREWLALSQIDIDYKHDDENLADIEIPEWLAIEKGLV